MRDDELTRRDMRVSGNEGNQPSHPPLRLGDLRWPSPTKFLEVNDPGRAEDNPLQFETLTLNFTADRLTLKTDPTSAVDDPMPGHIMLIAESGQSPAHMPGDSGAA